MTKDQLKELRQSLKMSVDDFAKLINYSRSAVQKFESGHLEINENAAELIKIRVDKFQKMK